MLEGWEQCEHVLKLGQVEWEQVGTDSNKYRTQRYIQYIHYLHTYIPTYTDADMHAHAWMYACM